MTKTYRDLLILAVFLVILTFLIWLPHLLRLQFYNLDFSRGFSAIYENYDGLEYVTIAKSFYDPIVITQLPSPRPASYYPSHFPGYSIFIAFFAPLLGFLKSMVFVSLLFTIFSAVAFYFLVRDFKMTSQPLWLSIIFLILPARWVIVHSIGSPEPVFIFFIILAIYFFLKFQNTIHPTHIWLSVIFLSFAQLTRPPGILIFLGLGAYILYESLIQKKTPRSIGKLLNYYPLLLVPLTLLGIFYLFQIQLGDFWAYFHSGDNIHLNFPPFQVFNKNQFWVGDIWLEDIVYIFILGFLGGLFLLKQKIYPVAFIVLTYLAASTLVAHRDIARYTLPIAPFILIAFEKVLVLREFKIVLIAAALAIYLYAQNFLIANTAPIHILESFN